MKSAAVAVGQSMADFAPISVFARRLLNSAAGGQTLTVLTYHRVSDQPRQIPPGIFSATADGFEQQLRLLCDEFNVVSADDLMAAADGAPLPARAAHVTFDDGYADFADHAWPVLRRLGVPASLFVPTGFPESTNEFWWDRLFRAIHGSTANEFSHNGISYPLNSADSRNDAYRAVRQTVKALHHEEAESLVSRVVQDLGVDDHVPATMDWATLARLAADGLAIGAHSHTHTLFDRIDIDRLRDELRRPRVILKERLGIDAETLAYPGGHVTPTVVKETRDAGYRLAFTTRRGVNSLGSSDWLGLRRINVGAKTTPSVLRCQAAAFGLALTQRQSARWDSGSQNGD